MPLESGNYINDLVITNPLGSDAKSTSDDHHRLIKKAIKQTFVGYDGAIIVSGTDTGSVNNYVLTPSTPLLAYSQNMAVVLMPINTNGGASTLNISGLGAVSILGAGGSPLIANELTAGIESILIYNGTSFQLTSVSKSYIDNLSFNGALPSTPLDGAVVRSVNGISQWAYVSPTLPLGDSIAAGQLVASDQNGDSIAVGTVTETVALVSSLNTTYTKPLTNGNLVHAYVDSGTSYGMFSILNPAGTILYGPITVISAIAAGWQCWPLSSGDIAFTWSSGGSLRYAIYSNVGAVVLAATNITSAAANNINCSELSNGNLVFGNTNASGYPTFIVYTQAGASVVAETVVESAAVVGSFNRVVGLSTGHILINYATGSNLRFAKYTNAGASVIAATTVATGVASPFAAFACEQANGNYSFVYTGATAYPRYGIVNTSFAVVYANTLIESSAVASSGFYTIAVVPLTGGSCAVTWGTSTTPLVTVRNSTGAETLAPFSPTEKTIDSLGIAKTLAPDSNGFYLSWDATYPSFIGPFNNNFIAGISAGFSTTKQLINVFGQYDAGSSIIDTLEKNTNYVRAGNRIVF